MLAGDCLKMLAEVPSNSVNLILTDFPYGVLNPRNEWDQVPDMPKIWQEFNRISKPNTAIITTAKQPFTSYLIMSNPRDFKYTLIWEKSKATGYLNSKLMPLVAHEEIVVFYKKPPTYNPQKTNGKPYNKGTAVRDTECYAKQTKAIEVKNKDGLRYPRSVQYFRTAESEGKLHPTQKPIALFEWLVKTYSNEGDIILDPFMGSGTTGAASLTLGRKFIGIERELKYYNIATERLADLGEHIIDSDATQRDRVNKGMIKLMKTALEKSEKTIMKTPKNFENMTLSQPE